MEARKVPFDLAFQPGEIDFFDKNLRQVTPLTAKGLAELLEFTQEIRVKGQLSVQMAADCDRCLENAAFSVEQDFDLLYRPAPLAGEAGEKELDDSAADLAFYEGGGLELMGVLREQVLLALPMQRICRLDCQGICPFCGQNRNQTVCNCSSQPVDDRWAALKDLMQ
jgi:uncharacterized protein